MERGSWYQRMKSYWMPSLHHASCLRNFDVYLSLFKLHVNFQILSFVKESKILECTYISAKLQDFCGTEYETSQVFLLYYISILHVLYCSCEGFMSFALYWYQTFVWFLSVFSASMHMEFINHILNCSVNSISDMVSPCLWHNIMKCSSFLTLLWGIFFTIWKYILSFLSRF